MIAGEGFCTFKIFKFTVSMNKFVVIAPIIVILLEVILTKQLNVLIEFPDIVNELQVSLPLKVNSRGKCIVMLEPEGTA